MESVITVRILLKCRADESDCTFKALHKALDELSCAVAYKDVFLVNTKVLCCQKTVDSHSGRIFREQCVKVCPEFILHSFRWEVGIYQVAEIKELRITPESAESVLEEQYSLIIIRSKDGFCNIKILDIVDLIPFLTRKPLGSDYGFVKHRDNTEDLLVVLILT